MNDLSNYRLDAINRAKKNISSRIRNDSIQHANILIETMIGLANNSDDICIYSGDLPANSYRESIVKTKAKSITIVLDNAAQANWICDLSDEIKSRIYLYQINKSRPNHFFFISSGAFRYEVDALSFSAEANFHEPETIEILKTTFDGYVRDSVKITLELPTTNLNYSESK
jgi:meiotically up-regulated gene 157 (Mug157) protein